MSDGHRSSITQYAVAGKTSGELRRELRNTDTLHVSMTPLSGGTDGAFQPERMEVAIDAVAPPKAPPGVPILVVGTNTDGQVVNLEVAAEDEDPVFASILRK